MKDLLFSSCREADKGNRLHLYQERVVFNSREIYQAGSMKHWDELWYLLTWRSSK